MSEMACVSGVELLTDYFEGVLPPDVRGAIDRHVAACPRCTAFIASYRETPRIIREATEVVLPAALQGTLRAWLREHRDPR